MHVHCLVVLSRLALYIKSYCMVTPFILLLLSIQYSNSIELGRGGGGGGGGGGVSMKTSLPGYQTSLNQ